MVNSQTLTQFTYDGEKLIHKADLPISVLAADTLCSLIYPSLGQVQENSSSATSVKRFVAQQSCIMLGTERNGARVAVLLICHFQAFHSGPAKFVAAKSGCFCSGANKARTAELNYKLPALQRMALAYDQNSRAFTAIRKTCFVSCMARLQTATNLRSTLACHRASLRSTVIRVLETSSVWSLLSLLTSKCYGGCAVKKTLRIRTIQGAESNCVGPKSASQCSRDISI